MDENVEIPNMPGYVSIQEAAKTLGVSDTRVYLYIEKKRLTAVRAANVLMIPIEEIMRFERKNTGRPRKNVPLWRLSSEDNAQFVTTISVLIHSGKQDELLNVLEEIKQSGEHLFPGTIARYITRSEKNPDYVGISLVWRGTVMPDEATREAALQKFREVLADVLDWDTAEYDTSRVLMHT